MTKIANPTIWLGVLLFAMGAPAARSGGRVLTTSDVVAIRIVDHPELDTTTRAEPDGTINFPYVGRIKAAGRTEDDLAHVVGRRLKRPPTPCVATAASSSNYEVITSASGRPTP
jgi:protein involved in polysaccharide export with SLBB domain